MTDKLTLLCFGRHQALLDSRVAVLAKTYHVFPVRSFGEMEDLPSRMHFDVILLCHTLQKDDCAAARVLIEQRWLAAKVLSMTKSHKSCASEGDTAVRGLDGPGVLLQRLETLMHPVEPGIGVVATPSPYL